MGGETTCTREARRASVTTSLGGEDDKCILHPRRDLELSGPLLRMNSDSPVNDKCTKSRRDNASRMRGHELIESAAFLQRRTFIALFSS